MIADPEAEVGSYIKDKPKIVAQGLRTGENNNGEGVPIGAHGRNIHDPQAEVGEHIKDKRKQVHADLAAGNNNNGEGVPMGAHGRHRDHDIDEQKALYAEQVRLEADFQKKMKTERERRDRERKESEERVRQQKEAAAAKQRRLLDAMDMAKRNENHGRKIREEQTVKPVVSETPILWSYKKDGESSSDDDDDDFGVGFLCFVARLSIFFADSSCAQLLCYTRSDILVFTPSPTE